MIVGIGIDIVEIRRIRSSLERFGATFARKLLHESELDLPEEETGLLSERFVQRLAARFAAKEAAVKALGCGFSQGVGLHEIRVLSLVSGQPVIGFHAKARERFDKLGAKSAHLSLTHTDTSAAAVVVLET